MAEEGFLEEVGFVLTVKEDLEGGWEEHESCHSWTGAGTRDSYHPLEVTPQISLGTALEGWDSLLPPPQLN